MNDIAQASGTRWVELFTLLAAPFGQDEVKVRVQAGKKLVFITARTVMNRLDTVLGPENWWDEYTPGEESVQCRLTIRLPDGSTLTKADAGGYAGMADQGDDDKSGYSDGLKRAAVKFGVGRYLYGDGVPVFVAARPAARKDPRPFATLVADELARRQQLFRGDHPGAPPVTDEDRVHQHLLRAAVFAGRLEDPGSVTDGKARRILGDLYKDPAHYGPMRKELTAHLNALFQAAEEAAQLEEAGDLVTREELMADFPVPAVAESPAGREPGEEG